MNPQLNMFRKGWTEGAKLAPGELPRDPFLPELSLILDGRAMADVMRDAGLPTHAARQYEIARCRVVNVRYRPARMCLVSYALDLDETGGGPRKSSIATAKIVSTASSDRHLSKRLSEARNAGVRFVHIPEHRLTLTEFPSDLRVPGVHRTVDPGSFQRIVRKALDAPNATLVESNGQGPSITAVSYRPERFCLFRASIRRTPTARDEVIYARVHRGGEGAELHEIMTALWNSQSRKSGLLSVAEPLGYDSGGQVLLQRAAAGVSLGAMALDESTLEYIAAAARSLAAVHDSSIQVGRTRSADRELDWIASIADRLGGFLPGAAGWLSKVVSRLRDTEAGTRGNDRCLVHGDMSLHQFLAEQGRVTLLDFDGAGMGDPYTDIGTLLARLDGHLQFRDDAARRRSADLFRSEYATTRRIELDEDRILWSKAVAFVRIALSGLGQLKPGWPDRMSDHLERAETLLDRIGGRPDRPGYAVAQNQSERWAI